MKNCAVAVIGHVDHGKTTLVGALTGIETDRLKEEKERGLSITLGFAYRDYPSGTVDFIDAPGHEDFIRAMVSGATGARAVMLVVSAVDGVERQTREHLQIATMLGINVGIVAITKSDLLPKSERQAQKDRIAAELAETSLSDQPILYCSAKSGEGLNKLKSELGALIDRVSTEQELAGFYLPIDRVFSAHGMGTVATGTLLGGTLDAGREAVIQPSGQRVTVRRTQMHGTDSKAISAGSRTAVNLRGVSVEGVKRGDVLCAPGIFSASRQVDVYLNLSPDSERPLKHVDDLRVMFGTSNVIASVRLLGTRQIEAGESGFAQLRFPEPVIAFAGQRAVLRRPSPQETMGGAVILDPVAPLSKANNQLKLQILKAAESGDLAQIAEALASRDGGIAKVAEIAKLACQSASEVRSVLHPLFNEVGKDLVAPCSVIADGSSAYMDRLQAFHDNEPAKLAAPVALVRDALQKQFPQVLIRHVESKLIANGVITLWDDQLAAAGHDPFAALPSRQRRELQAMEAALSQGALTPPDTIDLTADGGNRADLLQLLIQSGRAVLLYNFSLKKNLVFHASALEQGFQMLAEAFPYPALFKTGDARAALGTTRKFIVPVLEYFDDRGLTLREGDTRHIAKQEGRPAD